MCQYLFLLICCHLKYPQSLVSHHRFPSSFSLMPIFDFQWQPCFFFFTVLMTNRIKSKVLPSLCEVLPGLSPICFFGNKNGFLYQPRPMSLFTPFLFSGFPFSTPLPIVLTIFACLAQIKWVPPSGSPPPPCPLSLGWAKCYPLGSLTTPYIPLW